MARQTYFITGTDTGVGKTAVTCGLLALAAQAGWRTLAMKPIASGCEETEDGLRNEDALAMQTMATEDLIYELVNPVAMAPAIAPHVAAQQAGRSLSAARLTGFCRGMMTRPGDLLLIEGAGGWRVPLNEQETYAAVPAQLDIPVILVVGLRLGCINQALLSAEAIQRDGLKLAGWVANQADEEEMDCMQETLDYLTGHIPAPCLGRVPRVPEADGASVESMAAFMARYLALPASNKS